MECWTQFYFAGLPASYEQDFVVDGIKGFYVGIPEPTFIEILSKFGLSDLGIDFEKITQKAIQKGCIVSLWNFLGNESRRVAEGRLHSISELLKKDSDTHFSSILVFFPWPNKIFHEDFPLITKKHHSSLSEMHKDLIESAHNNGRLESVIINFYTKYFTSVREIYGKYVYFTAIPILDQEIIMNELGINCDCSKKWAPLERFYWNWRYGGLKEFPAKMKKFDEMVGSYITDPKNQQIAYMAYLKISDLEKERKIWVS